MTPRSITRRTHRISIAREQYKFSCAHMTVFPDGTKERLHGHNYTLAIALEVSDIALDAMVPFKAIKDALATVCDRWKEHFLLPTKSPHLAVHDGGFTLAGASYAMPRGDVLELPIDNISVESLASHAADILLGMLDLPPVVLAIEVTVEESPGQGATCRLELA